MGGSQGDAVWHMWGGAGDVASGSDNGGTAESDDSVTVKIEATQ